MKATAIEYGLIAALIAVAAIAAAQGLAGAAYKAKPASIIPAQCDAVVRDIAYLQFHEATKLPSGDWCVAF